MYREYKHYSGAIFLLIIIGGVLSHTCKAQPEANTHEYSEENFDDNYLDEDEYIRKFNNNTILYIDNAEFHDKITKINHNIETDSPKMNASNYNYTKKSPIYNNCVDKYYKNFEMGEKLKHCTHALRKYPYAVSIQKKGSHYAGGALIDNHWILSAGAEFYNVREAIKLFKARLGSVSNKQYGVVVALKAAIIHPFFKPGEPNHDVCLLRTAYSVDYTNHIRPIALTKFNLNRPDSKFVITYWPRVIIKGNILNESAHERVLYWIMRVSHQSTIPRQECRDMMKPWNGTLDESTLCLKPIRISHSKCMPDIGAPIVGKDGLWGLTSGWVSPECHNKTSPTLFTFLSAPTVRSWLEEQIIQFNS